MNDMATALAARKAVSEQVDELIRAAGRNVAKLRGADEMRESQIRNLVNLAAASRSVEEVTNFIRYQIGRDTKGKTWAHEGFGKAVIADIETGQVRKSLEAVVAQVSGADLVAVRSELIALYLGYMNRCFVYASKANDWTSFVSGMPGGEEPRANG
ncbi:MAG TPA: hypothetical protein VNZ44_08475 [Pyrinomonadaceae bacterium]|nr:hypothetical protein [Pyrinomonadaceae bacterium]